MNLLFAIEYLYIFSFSGHNTCNMFCSFIILYLCIVLSYFKVNSTLFILLFIFSGEFIVESYYAIVCHAISLVILLHLVIHVFIIYTINTYCHRIILILIRKSCDCFHRSISFFQLIIKFNDG